MPTLTQLLERGKDDAIAAGATTAPLNPAYREKELGFYSP